MDINHAFICYQWMLKSPIKIMKQAKFKQRERLRMDPFILIQNTLNFIGFQNHFFENNWKKTYIAFTFFSLKASRLKTNFNSIKKFPKNFKISLQFCNNITRPCCFCKAFPLALLNTKTQTKNIIMLIREITSNTIIFYEFQVTMKDWL